MRGIAVAAPWRARGPARGVGCWRGSGPRCGYRHASCATGMPLAGLAGLAWPAGDAQAARRAQPLFASAALPDRAFPAGIHRRDRDQGQRGLRLQGSRPTAPGRRQEQSGRRGADRGYRAARHLCGQGSAGAGRVRGADGGSPGASARPRWALVCSLQARAGDRGLKGPRGPPVQSTTYEGLGGPPMGRSRLFAARQPRLQQGA